MSLEDLWIIKDYLGEFPVDIADSEYKEYTSIDWALEYIFLYGQIDGDHHKKWVLDQVVRILNGAPIKLVEARWDNGHKEYKHQVGTSTKYDEWVAHYKAKDDNGDDQYRYDVGIPP